ANQTLVKQFVIALFTKRTRTFRTIAIGSSGRQIALSAPAHAPLLVGAFFEARPTKPRAWAPPPRLAFSACSFTGARRATIRRTDFLPGFASSPSETEPRSRPSSRRQASATSLGHAHRRSPPPFVYMLPRAPDIIHDWP